MDVLVPGTAASHREFWTAGAAAALEPLTSDGEGEIRLLRAFPNVFVAVLPNHAAAVVIKPTRLDGVMLVVSLFARRRAETEEHEEAVAALLAAWRAITDEARVQSRDLRPASSSPILAHARTRLAGHAVTGGWPS
jgi:hypothetical protein